MTRKWLKKSSPECQMLELCPRSLTGTFLKIECMLPSGPSSYLAHGCNNFLATSLEVLPCVGQCSFDGDVFPLVYAKQSDFSTTIAMQINKLADPSGPGKKGKRSKINIRRQLAIMLSCLHLIATNNKIFIGQ